MATYINPWHKPGTSDYGPAMYSTTAKPSNYRGFDIYERISDACFDVVKDGICISQRAGLNGAKGFIDTCLENPEDFFAARALKNLERAA